MSLTPHQLQFGAAPRALLYAAAMILCLAVAGRARAACGYYVVAQHPSESMASNADEMRSHVGAPIDAPRDCPCRGPMCRAHESSPIAPAASSSSSDQQYAIFSDTAPHLEQPFAWVALSPRVLASSVYPSAVDPPPRAR